MGELSREEWDEIGRKFREPFDPKDVDFRVQGRANEQTGKGQVVAYIDARAVQDRLDMVVGPGNWSFDWQPLVIDKGEVMVAKGILTIYGVSKADAGSASNFEQSLGAASHCFKRAAVHFGIGRYLYNLGAAYVSVEKGGRIPQNVINELRAKLPRPNQQQRAAQTAQTAQTAQPTKPARPAAAPAPSAEDEPQEWTDEDHRVEHEAGGGDTEEAQEAPAGVELLPNGNLTISQMKAFFVAHGGDNAAWAQLYTKCKGEKDAIRQSVNGHMRLKAHAQGAQAPQEATAAATGPMATDKQVQSIRKLCQVLGRADSYTDGIETISYARARDLITQLSADYNSMRNAESAQGN